MHERGEVMMSGRLTAEGYGHLPADRDIEELFPISSGSSKMARKPVVRMTDGEIFESAYAASVSMGLHMRAVSDAIRHQRRSGGHYWKLADDRP